MGWAARLKLSQGNPKALVSSQGYAMSAESFDALFPPDPTRNGFRQGGKVAGVKLSDREYLINEAGQMIRRP